MRRILAVHGHSRCSDARLTKPGTVFIDGHATHDHEVHRLYTFDANHRRDARDHLSFRGFGCWLLASSTCLGRADRTELGAFFR